MSEFRIEIIEKGMEPGNEEMFHILDGNWIDYCARGECGIYGCPGNYGQC